MAERPDRSQIVKTFGKEAAEFVDLAASLGWNVRWTSGGTSITLIPYDDGPKRIHLSAKNKGRGALRKQIKYLVKFADPQYVGVIHALTSSDDIPQEAQMAAVLRFGALRLDEDETAMQEIKEEPPPPKKEKAQVPTDKAVEERVSKKGRHIISERPALMHKGLTSRGGISYPSRTTLERRWSDGVIEYVCAVDGCGEVSQNRLAFRGPHYAMHVRKGEAPQLTGEERKESVLDPDYTEPSYTRNATSTRKSALLNLLRGINLAEIGVEELAEQIDAFLQTLSGGGGGASNDPLTPEQIIDRIRMLVDTGKYHEQEELLRTKETELQDLMEYAEKREAELEEKALIEQQARIKAESHLSALRDLINEGVTE